MKPHITVSAPSLTPGKWRARWGMWLVTLEGSPGRWEARLWSVLHGVRVAIGVRGVLATSDEAIDWVCGLLEKHGAMVFIDGRTHPLREYLAFEPGLG